MNQLNDQYTTFLRTATQDAGKMLNQNELQDFEAEYQSHKFFNANKDLAVDTFFRTLYLNFGISGDPIGQGALAAYIPVVLVIDYDGYHIYAIDEYKDKDGQTIFKHMWRPKKPYSYSDSNGNSINFTLDSYVHAYDASTRKWVQGYQEDLKGQTNIPLLNGNDTDNFDNERRSIIVKSIQEDLTLLINKHNEYAMRYGISYTFKLPLIPQEEWTNTIDDIGIMSFVQGIPVGDRYYNNYAFGGGRLVKKPVVYGVIDDNTGIKYYYREACGWVDYRVIETFGSEKDAAAAGYFPLNTPMECINMPKPR